jgi:hypothetical protein
MGHPAHFHNIKIVANNLYQKGWEVVFVARGKDVLFNLLENLPYTIYKLPEKTSSSKSALIKTVLQREKALWKIVNKHHPVLMMGTDIAITHIGKLTQTPAYILNEDDAEIVPQMVNFGYRFASGIIAPDCCSVSPYESKKISYNGYHELAYLHPNHFTPSKNIYSKLGIDENTPYFILRFVSLSAHHDKGIRGISADFAQQLIDKLKPFGRIFITSERKLESKFEPYRIHIHPKDMHNALAYAKIYIGDSQTMTAEAAVLGTPALRMNDFVRKINYLEELEHTYQLTYGYKPHQHHELLNRLTLWLDEPDLKSIWKQKQQIMLNDKIDVAAYLTNFIEKQYN